MKTIKHKLIGLGLMIFVCVRAMAQTVEVSIPDLSDSAGAVVKVPIMVNDVTGLGVLSYMCALTFDQRVLDARGYIIAGTLSDGWAAFFADSLGKARLAAAGTNVAVGSGVLAYIQFEVVGAPGSRTNLVLTDFVFNEGFPQATLRNGSFEVRAVKNRPPKADAGADILGVQAASYVKLDGSKSSDPDGDSLRYYWSSANPDVIIDTSPENPVAGFRPLEIGEYKFHLKVSDGREESAPDSVVVSVTIEAPAPLGYRFVDNFAQLLGAQGVVVDPEGKIWSGSYYTSPSSYVRVWNSDGTVPEWAPVKSGRVGNDVVSTMGNCYGLAIDKEGNVYYSNATEHVVLKFDYQTGAPLGGIRLSKGSPTMGVDHNGYLYVGTVVGDTVWIYDKDFHLINRVYVEYIGREVEVAPDGSVIYVGQFDGTVRRFQGSPTTGYHRIEDLPGPFTTADGPGVTSDIGFDMHGRLWVTEEHTTYPQRDFIHIYSPDLKFRESFTYSDDHPWDRPRGVGFDHNLGDSLIYIVDFEAKNPFIQRWAIPGTELPPIFHTIRQVAEVDDNGFPSLSNKNVKVRGIVTVAGEFGPSGPSYLQDAADSAGVAIYDARSILPDSVKIGDEIMVVGKVGFYNGLTEIDPVKDFRILSSGHTIVPRKITCADLAERVGERFQSQLVIIEQVHTNVTVFPSNQNVTISDRTGFAVMRIDKDTDIPGAEVRADSFSVVGVITQYDPQSPYWGGYQIMPRSRRDLAKATNIQMLSEQSVPKQFALYQNYPNPFNAQTMIKYDLPKDCRATLEIFNVLGQKVRTLVDGYQKAGTKSAYWDGQNQNGHRAAAGTYIYLLSAGDFQRSRRMILLP
ncbi:MAG: T9SS type A sorting domain-containing protein [candidate division KSB1 bacterium]|nr:T9SS type A sorting domain-containing protein [candidate division KSB1 bacterium]MDZ7333714.1 T9SS type A sorting domain-containing protein [candidate division KSB1 bacterium]MDZ7356162.1 T9SS type A sorting domain-containing protein [candidate division KSB1 bacterium]MDZ7398860.1 T9SS type A sorting domain-containing protein [candidate division KSB1 bacterium]